MRLFSKILDLFEKDYFQYIVYALLLVWFYYKLLRRGREKEMSIVDVSHIAAESKMTNKEAKIIADRLVDAFSWGWFGIGTDVALIKDIITQLSPEDLAKVHDAFGFKTYDGVTVRKDKLFGSKRNLAFILDSELGYFDKGLRRIISEKYKSIGVPFFA